MCATMAASMGYFGSSEEKFHIQDLGIRLGALEHMKTELGRELARQKEEETVFQTEIKVIGQKGWSRGDHT